MGRRYLNEFDKGAHSVYLLYFHLVIVTKYRQKILNKEMYQTVFNTWATVRRRISEEKENINILEHLKIDELAIESDHIHILFNSVPSVELSYFIMRFKSLLAKRLRQEHDIKTSCKKGAIFTPSYCLLTTGGAPVEIIKKYIERQG